jgi:hypothetical protein
VSLTRVDLPEPDTPVTQVSRPTGNATLAPLRLCPRALTTRISCSSPSVAWCAASRAARRSAAGLGGKRGLAGVAFGASPFFTTGSQGVRRAGTAI